MVDNGGMTRVTVDQTKDRLAELIERVAAGEDVVISDGGRPVARLVGVEGVGERRVPGSLAGQIVIGDDFDDPLPPDIQAAFDGEMP